MLTATEYTSERKDPMTGQKIYDLKAMTEVQWAIVIGGLGAVAGTIAQFFGGDTATIATTSLTVSSVARGIVGIFDGKYNWKSWWEVAWAGLQVGSGAIAGAIANTNGGDALTTTFVATTASSTARQVVATLIASVQRAFSAGLVNEPDA